MCQALCIINSFDSDDQPINKGAIYHCIHRGGNRGSNRWTGLVKGTQERCWDSNSGVSHCFPFTGGAAAPDNCA